MLKKKKTKIRQQDKSAKKEVPGYGWIVCMDTKKNMFGLMEPKEAIS
jgi:hypothetical protein